MVEISPLAKAASGAQVDLIVSLLPALAGYTP